MHVQKSQFVNADEKVKQLEEELDLLFKDKMDKVKENNKLQTKVEKQETQIKKLKKQLKSNVSTEVARLQKDNEAKEHEVRLLKELLKSNDIALKGSER